MHSENEDKSLVTLDEREARFKAMLQYLILREACEFDDKFPRDDSGAGDALEASRKKQEDEFKKKSAEKILREMELKFYDLFVEDDLVEDYLFLDAPCKTDAINQKSQFKTQIQDQILEKIKFINSTDTADKASQQNKKLLKKLFNHQ